MACNDDTDLKNNPKKSGSNSLNQVIATYNNRADTLIYNLDVDRLGNEIEAKLFHENRHNIVIERIYI